MSTQIPSTIDVVIDDKEQYDWIMSRCPAGSMPPRIVVALNDLDEKYLESCNHVADADSLLDYIVAKRGWPMSPELRQVFRNAFNLQSEFLVEKGVAFRGPVPAPGK